LGGDRGKPATSARAQREVFVQQHLAVRPTNRDNIQIPVAFDIDHLSTIVMFVPGVDKMGGPGFSFAVRVLEDEQARRSRVCEVMLTDDYILVAVPIKICDVHAHGADDVCRDDVLQPGSVGIGRLLIPGESPRQTRGLKSHYCIETSVAVDVGEPAPVRSCGGPVQRERGPADTFVPKPGGTCE
jgi:hypothetical protein